MPNRSSDRFFTATISSVANSALPAPSTCCPTALVFPLPCQAFLHHAGIKGFSTQKLSAAWQPAPHVGGPDSPEKTPEGIPFNVGIWEGTDGSTVIAALNPLTYGSQVTYDLSKTPPPPPPPDPNLTAQQNSFRTRPREDWVKRIQINGDLTGIKADYHYVGTGDIGGAPNESSVKLMEAIVTKGKASLPGPPSTPARMGVGRRTGRIAFGSGAGGRWPDSGGLVEGRSDVQRHPEVLQHRSHAAIQRRSRIDQPLGRIDYLRGISETLDAQERIAGRRCGEGVPCCCLARWAAVSAGAPERGVDAGDGWAISRSFFRARPRQRRLSLHGMTTSSR